MKGGGGKGRIGGLGGRGKLGQHLILRNVSRLMLGGEDYGMLIFKRQ